MLFHRAVISHGQFFCTNPSFGLIVPIPGTGGPIYSNSSLTRFTVGLLQCILHGITIWKLILVVHVVIGAPYYVLLILLLDKLQWPPMSSVLIATYISLYGMSLFRGLPISHIYAYPTRYNREGISRDLYETIGGTQEA